MKFLPASFRETQRDWFGKKGKSWHVTVAVTKSDSEDIEVNIDVKTEFCQTSGKMSRKISWQRRLVRF